MGADRASNFESILSTGIDDASEQNGKVCQFPKKPGAMPGLFKSVTDFCGEYVPLSYVVEPIIRTSSVYTLTAKTGSGKTALAVVMALAVATGRRDLLNLEAERGRVAYCTFENPDDVRMRILAATERLKIDLSTIEDSFLVLDVRSRPEELVSELRSMSADEGFALVIVDTLAAAFDESDMNDNVKAGEFVRRLRPLTALPGKPAVVIAAHPTKNASDDNLVPYGGGAILNEVDGNLTLAKRDDSDTTVLHWQGKFRGLEFRPIPYRLELNPSPNVIDRKGRPVTLPTLLPVSAGDVAQEAKQEIERHIQVLRAIAANPAATSQRSLAETTGIPKASVDRALKKLIGEKLIERGALKNNLRITSKGAIELKNLAA